LLKNCSTCGKQTSNYSEFLSPYSEQAVIVRCNHCRKISAPYTCPASGHVGP